ncbi:hypothetical protein F5884DRAFT_778987 [Xylogone sp. PMI_703]|nr:hypothetical protein F5884DRAFT_778987 [Xylogone sp. PMI_703]
MFSKYVVSALALATTGICASSPITSADGLVFNVLLTNQTTVGGPYELAVRLNEYNPSIGLPEYFDFYVGVDTSSPTLVGNLDDGVLYSQGIGPHGEPYNNTYVLYTNVETGVENTTFYTTGMGNVTADATFLDDGWQLVPVEGNATAYDLVHSQPTGTNSGWRLCVADFDTQYGPWSWLQYVTYTGDTAEESQYCKDVTVQTTLTS